MKLVASFFFGLLIAFSSSSAHASAEEIYKSSCASCHDSKNDNKEDKGNPIPRLEGQHIWYLEKAFADIKSGKRDGHAGVKSLSDGEVKEVLQYISAK